MNKTKLACLLFAALTLAACSPTTTTAPAPAPVAAPPVATVSSSCPTLTMSATPAAAPSREVTFAATLQNPPAGAMYNWAVTAGAITSGQGSAAIKVDPPTGEPVTVTVEIGGIPEACFGTATIEIP